MKFKVYRKWDDDTQTGVALGGTWTLADMIGMPDVLAAAKAIAASKDVVGITLVNTWHIAIFER